MFVRQVRQVRRLAVQRRLHLREAIPGLRLLQDVDGYERPVGDEGRLVDAAHVRPRRRAHPLPGLPPRRRRGRLHRQLRRVRLVHRPPEP